jgi:hypothetical protein
MSNMRRNISINNASSNAFTSAMVTSTYFNLNAAGLRRLRRGLAKALRPKMGVPDHR